MMKQKAWTKSLFILFAAVLLSGCSVLRNIPEGQYLLDKNTIKTDHPEYKENIKSIIKQKPNRRILGVFRFHLGVYFLANRGKTNGFKRWLKTAVGEEPVLLDTALTTKSSKQLAIYMQNNGYYNVVVKDSISRKKNTCRVFYQIESGFPYKNRNLFYNIKDSILKHEIFEDTSQSLIKKGEIYSNTILQKERERISTKLRDKGYYFFNPQYITFRIDSSIGNRLVDTYMTVSNPQVNIRDSLAVNNSAMLHKPCIIKEVFVDMDYDPLRYQLEENRDTLTIKGYKFLSNNKKVFLYKPSRLLDQIFLVPDSLFSQANIDLTYRNLADLGVFRFINIKFEEAAVSVDGSTIQLRCFINLSPSARQEYKIEAEGTNSGGNLGIAGNINYKNKNIFRGAESLNFRIKGGLEFQRNFNDTTYSSTQQLGLFNAYEVGPDISLNFPRFLGFDIKDTKFSNKNTSFAAGYNIQNRPEYFRKLANLSYFWSTRYGTYFRLFFYPAEINYLKVDLDPAFKKKLVDLNDINILLGYQDQLIADGRVSVIYSNQDLNYSQNYTYLRFNLEFAGNSLNAAIGHSTLFNVNYAQYIRPDIDYRFYTMISSTNVLVSRIATGLGYAYGNSRLIPFEKSFFSGGPNDVRAWRSRSIGPGSSSSNEAFERFGEFKIISNLEYRFDIYRKLKGAIFTDAGNIWLVRDIAERPGGKFQLNTFPAEIAIGSGLGIRFDFTFFIIRLDGAIKIKDPSMPAGERWVFKANKIKDVTLNFGIGYPF